MASKTETIGTPIIGFLASFATSMHLFQDLAIKGALAILTGFLGGAAAMLGKAFITWFLNKIKK